MTMNRYFSCSADGLPSATLSGFFTVALAFFFSLRTTAAHWRSACSAKRSSFSTHASCISTGVGLCRCRHPTQLGLSPDGGPAMERHTQERPLSHTVMSSFSVATDNRRRSPKSSKLNRTEMLTGRPACTLPEKRMLTDYKRERHTLQGNVLLHPPGISPGHCLGFCLGGVSLGQQSCHGWCLAVAWAGLVVKVWCR